MHVNTDRLRLELRRSRRPFTIWLALLACGLTATWLILKNQLVQWPWQTYYDVRVGVPSAKGIVAGQQEVRLAGVRIGVIQSVGLVGGHAVLTLSIDPKYAPLYRDAQLRIRPVTPLQDMYVDIESRGDPSAGRLPANQILPADETVAPVDISQVLNTFDPSVRQRMSVMLDELGKGLADHGQQLNDAFVQLAPFLHAAQNLTQVMAARQSDLAYLVHNFSALTGALSTRDRQITSLVSVSDQTLSALAAADQPLDATLGELPPTLAAIRSSFATVRAAENHLDPALVALRPVATALQPGLAALERFAVAATPALAALQPAVRALNPLASVLAPTSAALDSAFAALSPQAPRLDRITQKVARCETPLEGFFNWTLSVTKFAGNDGAIPRGEVTFGADSGSGGSPTLVQHPGCTS